MRVYGSRDEVAASAACLERIRAVLGRLEGPGPPRHDDAVELLIECGELEQGVVDALCPDRDHDGPIHRAMRTLTLAAGRLLWHAWEGHDPGAARAAAQRALAALRRLPLPGTVRLRIPEGFAWYGLHPETYLEAGRRFAREVRPQQAVCVGLRSIGTSLSAAVAAPLAASGCRLRAFTVRPRGPELDRRLVLAPALRAALSRLAHAWLLIVDEGPGLSGSSLTGAARDLAALGFADERIVLFPAWEPDGSAFANAEARARWPAHRKVVAYFDETWLASGRLLAGFGPTAVEDLSAGRWRERLWPPGRPLPPVHPQQERRKLLLRPRDGPPLLLKFAGLGRRGRETLRLGELLAGAGFAPTPLGLRHGYAVLEFVPGLPRARGRASRAFLDRLARYLAFRAAMPAARAVPFDALVDMAQENVREGLGEAWSRAATRLGGWRACIAGAGTCVVDGRMLAHEWIDTPRGILKTDGTDHHDDHLFPGCQDVAWDLAGIAVEHSPATREAVLARLTPPRGEPDLRARLPFYDVAYAAFRLGCAVLAARTLGPGEEAARWARQAARYRAALRASLARLPERAP